MELKQTTGRMNRHFVLILGRILSALLVIIALPVTQMVAGAVFRGDGQLKTNLFIPLTFIGLGAGAVYMATGCLFHRRLRRRRTKTLVYTEMILLGLFLGLLTFVGVSAQYPEKPPPPGKTR
jgi:hypothetical protein